VSFAAVFFPGLSGYDQRSLEQGELWPLRHLCFANARLFLPCHRTLQVRTSKVQGKNRHAAILQNECRLRWDCRISLWVMPAIGNLCAAHTLWPQRFFGKVSAFSLPRIYVYTFFLDHVLGQVLKVQPFSRRSLKLPMLLFVP
jgi:hypothetical protein